MIRIGIVGCGRILAAHLRGYRLLREAGIDDFQVTALCSRKADDALGYVSRDSGPPQRKPVSDIPGDPLAIGEEYLSDFQPGVDVKVYTDYEEMITAGPIDAVNDFTIHSLHHQIADLAFRHGKHLMSQKPLAVTMEAARRMCEQADAAGVSFGVFENARFRKDVRQIGWALSEEGDATRGFVPGYRFRILNEEQQEVGHLNFRVGDTVFLDFDGSGLDVSVTTFKARLAFRF